MIDYRPVINLPHVGLVKRMYKRPYDSTSA